MRFTKPSKGSDGGGRRFDSGRRGRAFSGVGYTPHRALVFAHEFCSTWHLSKTHFWLAAGAVVDAHIAMPIDVLDDTLP